MNPLDLLERVAPVLGGYPRWARALFGVALALALASIGVYAAYFNSATEESEKAKLSVALSLTAGTPPVPLNADEVQEAPNLGHPFLEELRYVSRRARIVPKQEYLDSLRAGKPVEAMAGLTPHPWTAAMRPAVLDLKVVNNTDRSVLFSEAILKLRSLPDRRPVLVPWALHDHPRRLTIVNYGWGRVTRVEVLAAVAAGGATGNASVDAGHLQRSAEVDLSDAFGEAGFDLAALRAWEEQTPRDPDSPQARAAERALAPFGLNLGRDQPAEVEAPITGEIHYWTRDANGEPRTTRFSADVSASIPLGIGDFQPVTARYESVELAVRGHDYERRVPISQSVKPGDTDRFEIPLAADRSSLHDLRVSLLSSVGETETSAPVTLELFVPRIP